MDLWLGKRAKGPKARMAKRKQMRIFLFLYESVLCALRSALCALRSALCALHFSYKVTSDDPYSVNWYVFAHSGKMSL